MQQSIYHCFNSIEHIEQSFAEQKYICDRKLATTIYLSTKLGKPLFLEGEPGVGKTEVAKVLSKILDTQLIRLQCYEGLDTTTALYEWNYPRQMLELRLQEARDIEKNKIGNNIFSEEFLFKRPLLQAIQSESDTPPVLLIDEVDRSDEEFEAFLLEVLSDFQITIPELGTIKAKQTPIVILTSNNTRQLHDALKRRCLFNYIDYPDLERERLIVKTRVPRIQEELSEQICQFMQWIRSENLYKRPGIAETIDWAEALLSLGKDELSAEAIDDTIGCILKYKQDVDNIQKLGIPRILEQLKHDVPNQHAQ
jgi:MoxR-like ATPase